MKEYPKRIDSEENERILNSLEKVCECGHGKYMHPSFDDLKCQDCTCPEFKFEQELPLKEVFVLHRKINNMKGVFSQ